MADEIPTLTDADFVRIGQEEGLDPREVRAAYETAVQAMRAQSTPEATQPAQPSLIQRVGQAINSVPVPPSLKGVVSLEGWGTKDPYWIDKAKTSNVEREKQTNVELLGEVAQSAVPYGAGRLVPAGRTLPRVLGTVGATLGLGGAVGAGESAMQGESPNEGLLQGLVRQALPAFVQGVGAVAIGPARHKVIATKEASKAAGAFKGTRVSPNVAALIDPKNPRLLGSQRTAEALDKAAGANLDVMEAAVGSQLGGVVFHTTNAQGLPAQLPFQAIRAQIKALRSHGDAYYAELQKGIQVSPAMMQQHINNQIAVKAIETDMLQQMRAQGFRTQADLYEKSLRQYEYDKHFIRAVKDYQASGLTLGNANATDYPELWKASRSLSPTMGGTGSSNLDAGTAAHGIMGIGAASKGHSIAAGYGIGRFTERLMPKSYPGDVLTPAEIDAARMLRRSLGLLLTAPPPLPSSFNNLGGTGLGQ